MKKINTLLLLLFIFNFSFGQLSKEDDKIIKKIIEKNKKLIFAPKPFNNEYQKNFSVNVDISCNEDNVKYSFDKLPKYKINIGFKDNEYYLIEDANDINTVLTIGENENGYIYNENIILYISNKFNCYNIELNNRKTNIENFKHRILNSNINLKTLLSSKIELNKSILAKELFKSLVNGEAYYDPLINEINFDTASRENINFIRCYFIETDTKNENTIKNELTNSGLNFIKSKVYGDVNAYALFSNENFFQINSKKLNLKGEDDFKKGIYTGNVKDYKKNGYNYTGSLVNGIYEGQGRLSKYDFVNNDETKKRIWTEYSYEGTFKNGEFDGQGKESTRKGVTSYSGNYNRINYEFKFDGNFKNGKYEGFGKLSVASWDINNYKYEGEFKNGIYDGKGKIEYDYDRSKSKYRTISYDGNWKNGTYNGKGELYVFDKNNSNNLNAFTKYNGLFVDGKKEGNFSVKGDFVKYVDSNYSFSYDCLYKNDIEISRKVNFDDGDKFIKLYNEQIEAQRAAERAEKQQKCNNCIIDWKKSTTPKDEYSLWIKIGRKSGEIVMLNGDIYKFDFENGKCKVINGWLVSDNYYPTFDNMIENIIEKCTEKYCR